VIGGTGNHLLGRRVIEASREAFGPPPPTFPGEVLLESHESEESTAPVEDDPSI
jgi:hypothetical protein